MMMKRFEILQELLKWNTHSALLDLLDMGVSHEVQYSRPQESKVCLSTSITDTCDCVAQVLTPNN
jgi:hypothetical protein